MCLIFVGIVEKYPQSVITGDSRVQFLVHPDCAHLKVNVFSASNMRKWDVNVHLSNNEQVILKRKKFDEKTLGWNLHVDLTHAPRTKKPRRIVVSASEKTTD